MSAAPLAERAINKPCSRTEFLVIRQRRGRGQSSIQRGVPNRTLELLPKFFRSTGVFLTSALPLALSGARPQPLYCIACQFIVEVQLTFGRFGMNRFNLYLQALTQLREGEALRD